jgi:hypothetical protein
MSVPSVPPITPARAGPLAERSSLKRLRALLLDEGGMMASLVGFPFDPPSGDSDGIGGVGESIKNTAADSDGYTGLTADTAPVIGPAQLAASGPRAEGGREDYELVVEAIYEGYLLHYGTSRVVRVPEADLGLLAGDQLYAIGLARLVDLGDTEAVAELADMITLSALAQGAGEPELADAVWTAGARAVGWGSSDAHRRAKELAFAGAAEAIEAMRTSAAGLFASP